MKLNELFGIKYPFIQGGMANIATGAFAAAVSNAGALGTIGAGGMNTEQLREEIRTCKDKTQNPFAVNLMLMNPHADEMAKMLVEEGVKIVTTGAGMPGKYLPMWKESGMKVFPVTSSVAIAKRLEKATLQTIEEGYMTGDIARIAEPKAKDVLDSWEFISAIRSRL